MRLLAGLLLGLLLVVSLFGSSPRPAMPATLREHLAALTGPNAKDCGAFVAFELGGQQQNKVLECVKSALGQSEPFSFNENQISIDVVYSRGWVRTSKGSLLSYQYYDGNINTSSCPDPNVYTQGRSLNYACEKPK